MLGGYIFSVYNLQRTFLPILMNEIILFFLQRKLKY